MESQDGEKGYQSLTDDKIITTPIPNRRDIALDSDNKDSPNRVLKDTLINEAQGDIGVGKMNNTKTGTSRNTDYSNPPHLSMANNKSKDDIKHTAIPLNDMDHDIVGWDSQDDPAMPLNFPSSRKWLLVSLLSCITFMTPFASSILAPAIGTMGADYGEADITKASMPVSIFLLGYAVGPLFLSPLSEIYGRNWILVGASAFFCTFLIGCALAPSLDPLIFFRFMSGVGGSACQTIGGAIIADLFPVAERGGAMSLWMMGPMLGPTVGPIIGGFVSETIGWRWVSWLTFISATAVVIIMTFLNRETSHQVLIERKTLRMRRELNRPELRSCYVKPDRPQLSKRTVLLQGLVRPIKMLFTSPIIFVVSLYIAFAYGCLYLLFNTITMVFQGTYGWSIGVTGLVYIALLVGYVISLLIFRTTSDRTVVRLTAENSGMYEPEMRLSSCIWFAILIPISFFWYGWSADQRVFWVCPVLGIIPFSIGIVGIWMPIQAYIIDAYPKYAASGLAAFSVLRCTVAAFLPLAGPQMYDQLGVGWGTSVLGFIALALVPIPIVIYRYGKPMRKKYSLNL